MIEPTSVIDYWYRDEVRKYWFKSTPEFDQQLSDRFFPSWQQALAGDYDHWMESADGCLALCILLDQIPRNIFRGKEKSYSSDAKAVAVCKQAIASGLHESLSVEKSQFLYMPLMHSEALEDQDLAIEMFAGAGLTEQSKFAVHHRDIVARFGRFPHRNERLGRTSTATELEYLQSKAAFKG